MEELAKELLHTLMSKMMYRGELPEEGWAIEQITNALNAAQLKRAADGAMAHVTERFDGDGKLVEKIVVYQTPRR